MVTSLAEFLGGGQHALRRALLYFGCIITIHGVRPSIGLRLTAGVT